MNVILKKAISVVIGIFLVVLAIYSLTKDPTMYVYEDITKTVMDNAELKSPAVISDDISGSIITDDISDAPSQQEDYSNSYIDGLQVHYIDVGQGDCTLVRSGTEAMLIDGGDNNVGTKIQNYLNKQGVKTLNYVVSTHGDADHCGSLDVIITKFNCENILANKATKGTATERDMYDAISYKGYKYHTPSFGETFMLGSAVCEIIGPVSYNAPDVNDNSIVVKVSYGDTSFIFMGDAGELEECSILGNITNVGCDVLKLGHHGSNTSSSDAWLETVNPKCAVVSCSLGNEYGHPHPSVLNKLRSMGVELYRTDEEGTLIVSSDGNSISWNMPSSQTWITGWDYQ